MKPTFSHTSIDTASHMESLCRERLHALVRGEFSEEEFINECATVPENIPRAEWDLAEWINRQHNSGQVPDALFHSLESKIAKLDGGVVDVDDGDTAELYPLGRRPRSRPPEFIEGPSALARRVIEPGAMLRDRYLIEARLGSGGMGTVYKALDKFRSDLAETNRHVAIKILNDDITNRPEVFARLRREFYCAQSLSHRNIVRVYELDRDGDLAFFTMEFLEGELLSRIIERFAPGTVTRSYAWRVVREVGAALTHAHARDVVHADLKPQNVLITHSGDVRLLDFGTSSANVKSNSSQNAAPTAMRLGPTALTPAYASCELLEGRRPDPRDDLFAFACLTYEILTGEHPFGQRRSTDARAQGLKPVRPANIGEQQWKMLSLGLAFNRADRSMSIRDWVLAINQPDEVPALLETQPVLTRSASADPQPVSMRTMPAAIVAADVPAVPAAIAQADDSENDPPAGVPMAANEGASDPAPGVGVPVPVSMRLPAAAVGHDVLVVEARPVRPGVSAARWMLVGLLVLAAGLMWSVARRPGAQPPPSPAAAAAVAAVNAIPATTPTPAATAASMARPTPARVPAAAAAPMTAARVTKALSIPKPAALPATPAIGIERRQYRVHYGRHFVEVHVIRSAAVRDAASFVWWTEAGTALPDEDFFPQARTIQTFSAGVRTATMFIRIVPNPAHRAPVTFYVQIGSPSAGHVLGGVTKVPIVVLPRRSVGRM